MSGNGNQLIYPGAPASPTGFVDDYDEQQADIQRRLRLAQLLQQQSMQAQNITGKGSFLQPLAQMLQAYVGKSEADKYMQQSQAMTQQRGKDFATQLQNIYAQVPGEPVEGQGPPTAEGELPPMLPGAMRDKTPNELRQAALGMIRFGKSGQDIASEVMKTLDRREEAAQKKLGNLKFETIFENGKDQKVLVDSTNPANPIVARVGGTKDSSLESTAKDIAQYTGVSMADAIKYAANVVKITPAGENVYATDLTKLGGGAAPVAGPGAPSSIPIEPGAQFHGTVTPQSLQAAIAKSPMVPTTDAPNTSRVAINSPAVSVLATNQGQQQYLPTNEVDADSGKPLVRDKNTSTLHVLGKDGTPNPAPFAGSAMSQSALEKEIPQVRTAQQGIADAKMLLGELAKPENKDVYGTRAAAAFKVLPSFGGAAAGASGLTPEQLSLRTQAANATADITHSMYGSAFSANEQKQATEFLIQPGDGLNDVQRKLRGRIAMEERHLANQSSGAVTSEAARRSGNLRSKYGLDE
jgi:hypothetical protein